MQTRPQLPHSVRARDSALRKLSRVNRGLVAASVALAAVLTKVAAQAFPGRTIHTVATSAGARRTSTGGRASERTSTVDRARSLRAPAQAPRSVERARSSSSGSGAAASNEATQPTEAASPREETQTTESQASSPSAEPESRAAEGASSQPEAPVVSGGS